MDALSLSALGLPTRAGILSRQHAQSGSQQPLRQSAAGSSSSPRATAMSTKDWASNFWITLVDENGETFYANPATGERKWQLEPGKLVLPRSEEGEWYELWSDEHNLPYYFQTRTNETSWYKPDGFVIPLKAVQRFSAGKRFSLSSEAGVVLDFQAPPTSSIPEEISSKPLPSLPTMDSFEELARQSLESFRQLQKVDISHASDDNGDSQDSEDEGEGSLSLSAELMEHMHDFSSYRNESLQSELSASPSRGWQEELRSSPSSFATFETARNNGSDGEDTISLSQTTSSTPSSSKLNTPALPQVDTFSIPSLSEVRPGMQHKSSASTVTQDAYGGVIIIPETTPSSPEKPNKATDRSIENIAEEEDDTAVIAVLDTSLASLASATKNITPLRLIKKKQSKKALSILGLGLGEAFDPTLNKNPSLPSSPLLASPKMTAQKQNHAVPSSPSSMFSSLFSKSSSSPSSISSPKFGKSSFSSSTTAASAGPASPTTAKIPATPTSPIRAAVVSCFGNAVNASSISLNDSTNGTESGARSPKAPKAVKNVESPKYTLLRHREDSSPLKLKSGKNTPRISSPTTKSSLPVMNIAPTAAKRQTVLLPNVLNDIQRFTLDEYAQQHFAQKKKKNVLFGVGAKQNTVLHAMKWQAEDLESPILNLGKQFKWDAQQSFMHLQYIMGDRSKTAPTSPSPESPATDSSIPSAWDSSTTEEARKLLTFGISTPELRDEIYVHLLCQLTDNPSAISIYRGWQFLQVLLVTFPPSPSLEPTLRQFLLDRKGISPQTRPGIIARYALSKLDAIIVKGPRGKVPSLFEIKAASEAAFQPSVFGESLQRIMSLQSEAYPDSKIPIILSFLTDGILALGGLRAPGIFRVSGDMERVNELRITIDQGKYSLAGYEDPYIAASLFKLWLRELAQPLIPESCYQNCIAAASQAKAVVEIVQKLPSLNRRIVAFVVSFLQIFVQGPVIKDTTISASSLAMIFTPTLFRGSGDVTTVFQNAKIEQQFVLHLLEYLDVSRLQDEDDWIPTHNKTYSGSSATSSSYSSETYTSTSESSGVQTPLAGNEPDVSRASLDSESSSAPSSTFSYKSIASSKRVRRPRTQTLVPAPLPRITVSDSTSSLQESLPRNSMDTVSSAETDRKSLRRRSRSDSCLAGKNALLAEKVEQQNPTPAPKFIKPRIVIEEADD